MNQLQTMANRPSRTSTRAAAPVDHETVRSWLSVVRAYHLCEALMSRRLAALDVKLAEHEILANLLREPGLSQQGLAQRCFSAKSHISGLIGSLEQRGLVRREPDPADARAKCLHLTPEGEVLARRSGAVQAEVVRLMTQDFSAAELAQVEQAMNRLSQLLEGALGTLPD